MQRFLMHQDRDSEPGLLHRPTLGSVDIFGGVARIAVDGASSCPGRAVRSDDAALVGWASDLSQSVGKILRCFLRRKAAVVCLDFPFCSQTLISCATFSSRVIRDSKSSTRRSTGCDEFR